MSLTTASATTYYVSPSGSDSNNGTSTSTPWQTIAKVNAATFNGGDSLLLQGGQSFTGSMNLSRARVLSTPTSHFTVGAYGSGKPTIISTATGSNSYAILLSGVSGVVLQDLIVRPGTTSPQAGIYIKTDTSGNPVPDDITVQRCDSGGFHYAPTNFGGEIFVNGYWGSLKNIKIQNNVLHGLNGPSSPDDNGFSSLGNGKNILNLTVQGNIVYDIGGTANCLGGSIGNGILANGVNGGVLQHNLVHDCGARCTTCGGPGGIWAYNSNSITIQFNEVYNMQPTTYTAGCDWTAYDLDGKVTNSVVQYNYSHHNYGPAMLAYVDGTWGPNTFRYNISENDCYGTQAAGPISIGGPSVSGVLQIYNNTVYDGSVQSTNNHACIYGPHATGTWGAGSMIKNNICYITNRNSNGTVNVIYFPYLPQTNLTFNNNDYYLASGAGAPMWRWGGTAYSTLAAYQTATGFDTSSSTSNPQLVSPGSGGTLSWNPTLLTGPQPAPAGYALATSSLLFGAGANLTSIVPGPGSRDYYGNTTPNGVGSGYNIGAYGKSTGAGGSNTISPEADTYAYDGATGTNYGTVTSLAVKTTSAGLNRISYLRFPVSGTATTVTLKLKVVSIGAEGAGARPVEVRQLATDTWSETGLTWANRPASTGALIGTIPDAGVVGQTYSVNVTSYVNSQSSDGKASFVLVQPANAGRFVCFGSREDAANKPILEKQ